MHQPRLALRSRGGDDHHLFNNNGTWWLRYSVSVDPRLNAVRRAASLGTACIAEARARRDVFLEHLDHHLRTSAAAPSRRLATDGRIAA